PGWFVTYIGDTPERPRGTGKLKPILAFYLGMTGAAVAWRSYRATTPARRLEQNTTKEVEHLQKTTISEIPCRDLDRMRAAAGVATKQATHQRKPPPPQSFLPNVTALWLAVREATLPWAQEVSENMEKRSSQRRRRAHLWGNGDSASDISHPPMAGGARKVSSAILWA
ncbi:hypothetical protein I7I51_06100, partial [Histoplasma capsulatum]